MLVFCETSAVIYTFYFIISIRIVSSITEKKISKKSMAIFLSNEINSSGGDITGPTAHVQIMFSLKDKNCRVFEDILQFWDVDE